ncbi:hypothetical protein Q1695_011427 [Nippostrongylus brasiliensis]|nr:hypothetical protein Q1695_011427 [Nippostrongylus brasiliensis]
MVAIATRFQQAGLHWRHTPTGAACPHLNSCWLRSNGATPSRRNTLGSAQYHLQTLFLLPNQLFCNKNLVSSTEASHRAMFVNAIHCAHTDIPFYFLDVNGSSKRAISGSHPYDAESRIRRQLVLSLLSKSLAPSPSTIIT